MPPPSPRSLIAPAALTLRAPRSRVLLRLPTDADRDEYLDLRRANRAWLAPWEATPPGLRTPFTPAAFDRFLSSANTESSRRFLVCLRQPTPRRRGTSLGVAPDALSPAASQPPALTAPSIGPASGPIIGVVSLGAIVRGAFLSCFLGYWIARDHAGRGLMREAITLALDHAFGPMRLHRVEANIIPRNAPSRRLVRALGFRHEGTARRYLRIAGVWEDHQHWAITSEEWRKPRPQKHRDPAGSPRGR